jgi:hypothetical protein
MTPNDHPSRPVSATLETDLRTWLHKHGIVVWLDRDASYTTFVDHLISMQADGMLPYAVYAYRGSYLELLLALERAVTGSDPPRLLLHLPGFTEDDVREGPLLELYEAGARYRRALPTLVSDAAAGRVTPDQINAFLSISDLTLDAADTWLTSLTSADTDGFSTQVRSMQPVAVLDDLLSGGFVASRLRSPSDANSVWQVLSEWTGLPSAWREAAVPGGASSASDVAFTLASWALAVEYVHDLQRAPEHPILASVRELPKGVVDTCHALATHLRARHPTTYQRVADETETLLHDEVAIASVTDLGKRATFRFEEDLVLQAALTALQTSNWSNAGAWAAERTGDDNASVWLRDNPHRRSAWALVDAAATLGSSIDAAGARLAPQPSLEAALDAYAQRGAHVDQAHRHLEQRRSALLYPQVPSFETIRSRLDDARRAWHTWADQWARDFNDVCREHGFLPPTKLQQRALFDDVVAPTARESGTTALFLIDALRYEMAEELYRQLETTPATNVHLRGRLAELPSVTEVGMNALAPVARNARLRPALTPDGDRLTGFSSGEFRVFDPETRKRAMHERVGGATCPWLSLSEVTGRDASSLKRSIAQARLVIVHDREIDTIGERGAGARIFDGALNGIRAAWRLLRDAGVQRFIITSDHGFLLLHDQITTRHTYGRRSDPQARYVLTRTPAEAPDTIRVPLADLGYEDTDAQVLFLLGIGVFDTGRPTGGFVHGGNSLQERVIPVLTLKHRSAAGGSGVRYTVSASAREGVGGLHCIEITLQPSSDQGTLDFGSARSIELALRTPEYDDIHVELVQTRGQARARSGVIDATVGASFEVFFRLSGPRDTRVLVEVYHPSATADVTPDAPDTRFAVTAERSTRAAEPTRPETVTSDWLDAFDDAGVRSVFEHLARHGAVTEPEAAAMLGSQRALRRFAAHFEGHAAKAPYEVRIDIVGGVKRYVREGNHA